MKEKIRKGKKKEQEKRSLPLDKAILKEFLIQRKLFNVYWKAK